MSDIKDGLILFAHGSADPDWLVSIEALAERTAAKMNGAPVEPAFLKGSERTIYTAASTLEESGCGKITVVPVFLAAGAHSKSDFPQIGNELREKFPQIEFGWTDVIGHWDEALEALSGVISGRINKA